MIPIDLGGKVALVTGSARGIGRTSALRLAEAGADLVVTWASNKDAGLALVREIEGLGRRAVLERCDVADTGQIDATVEAGLARFGRIDILVANAGAGIASPVTGPRTPSTITSSPSMSGVSWQRRARSCPA
jgi:NAD(P)-dependent dehydrogenase (short-subunit alcohol dehydrogenase family)